MWHPCRLLRINRGDALNYLKVSSSVIVLRVVYPVGIDKSVSMEPQLEYSDGKKKLMRQGFCFLPLERTMAGSPERHHGIIARGCSCPKLFFALNDFVYR